MSAYELVTSNITFTGDATYDSYTLTAPAGKKPISGGIQQTDDRTHGSVRLVDSYPSGSTWHYTVLASSSATTATLYLVCLPTYLITAD